MKAVVADEDGVDEGVADTVADTFAVGVTVTVGVDEGEAVVTVLALMTRLSVAEADAPAVAVTTTGKVPDAVGVPLIVPPELIESPAGRPVAVHVAAPVPPVAATVAV
jgi:hypothetical protein